MIIKLKKRRPKGDSFQSIKSSNSIQEYTEEGLSTLSHCNGELRWCDLSLRPWFLNRNRLVDEVKPLLQQTYFVYLAI